MKVGVVQGRLRDFDLAQVLQVVGIGRQYMGVEVRHDSNLVGTIFVKSGKVVSAETPHAAGRDALLRLLGESDGDFYVFRTATPDNLPEPLGAVDRVLMDVIAESRERRTSTAPSVMPFAEGESPTHVGVAPAAAYGSSPPAARVTVTSGAPVPNAATYVERQPALPPLEQRSAPAPRPAAERKAPHDVAARASSAPPRVVAVASPKGGCGKTTIALNLALSLARQGRRVVLVDADINGDVLSAVNARARAQVGAYDVLLGVAASDDALLHTVLPNLKIMPAIGDRLPGPEILAADHTADWRRLLADLTQHAEVVVVDTPSGMFGTTHGVLAGSTHVLGVLQAEVVAHRSFARFMQGLSALPEAERPSVLGVVVNMLQMKHGASLGVFQGACQELPAEWLFDTSIPRHPAFLDATEVGLPLRNLDEQAPPAVAFLFDNLAAEVAVRLKLPAVERRHQAFLL